jgi:hypothetical protein
MNGLDGFGVPVRRIYPLQLTVMPQLSLIALAAIPAVMGLYHSDGTGRLPAMGWNSWVRSARSFYRSHKSRTADALYRTHIIVM